MLLLLSNIVNDMTCSKLTYLPGPQVLPKSSQYEHFTFSSCYGHQSFIHGRHGTPVERLHLHGSDPAWGRCGMGRFSPLPAVT